MSIKTHSTKSGYFGIILLLERSTLAVRFLGLPVYEEFNAQPIIYANVHKSETDFWKQYIITQQWKHSDGTKIYIHKIVPSSAMYYQHLIIIQEKKIEKKIH